MRDGLNYTNRGLLFKPMFTKFRDILLNFDDSLIDNTKKIKYLDVKDNKYIDINDFKTNHNQCEPNTKPDVNYNIHNDKVFNVLKTDMPDIYELYDDDDKRLGEACVPTLKASQYLVSKFTNTLLNEKVKIKFSYNDKFNNKWVPIITEN